MAELSESDKRIVELIRESMHKEHATLLQNGARALTKDTRTTIGSAAGIVVVIVVCVLWINESITSVRISLNTLQIKMTAVVDSQNAFERRLRDLEIEKKHQAND